MRDWHGYQIRDVEDTTRRDEFGRILSWCPDMDRYDNEVVDAKLGESVNLICSLTSKRTAFYGLDKHRPVLDIDFPARLLPSTTPGHFHLYLDGIELTDLQYGKLLNVLAEVGIIQQGVKNQFDRLRATFVRPPWVKKIVKGAKE